MKLNPNQIRQYHVFLASPGDVAAERRLVHRFFDKFNRHTAPIWQARFEVVDWENYATIGVGRPQELITQQTLEKYRDSLALVIGIMAQRFGSPSGKAESGTEEEFNWAMESHQATGAPEIKWFFRKVDTLEIPAEPEAAEAALGQWKKVCAFRKRMQDLNNPVFYAEYPNEAGFDEVLERDLSLWLADPARPWAAERAAHHAALNDAIALPAGFDAEGYRGALIKRFDKLNFEMLDTTGPFYSAVRLGSVFVAQAVRECHQYNPWILEIPKEYQRRLLDAGEITVSALKEAEQQPDRARQAYFQQPLRPVLDVVDEALGVSAAGSGRKLVILGDPGSGKSSLIRYLALRWASIAEPTLRDTEPIPLVVELGVYARWDCEGRKDFVRYLEEGPVWHEWPRGLLKQLLGEPGRVVMLLDGLDEVFDLSTRELVLNDIHRFGSQFAKVPVVLTSRVVGYQAQRFSEAGFRHFMLQDLDSKQITDFLNRWHEITFDDLAQAVPKRDRLQKAISDSKSIAMLAGNPLLLTMMAILNRNQELPRDRADLYAQASRLLLHQWDTERALAEFPDMSSEIGLREKTDILRRIAAHLQAAPGGLKGNLIDGPTLSGLIEDYLQNELHFSQARAVTRAVVEQLRHRNFILCFVGADSYAFVHRTFLEYFCAADFVHQFNVAKTLDIDGLIALFDQHCRHDEWREVLRLICGQIDGLFVGRIVEHLAARTVSEEWNEKTPLQELALAIGCLSEVRNLTRLETVGSRLMQTCIAWLEGGQLPSKYWFTDLLPAARELGERWPGKACVYEFRHPGSDSLKDFCEQPWVALIAAVDSDRERMTNLTGSDRIFVRASAFWFIAQKWPDQATRDVLSQRVFEDESEHTRGTSLLALATNWPDQITRDLLKQRAVQDDGSFPRSAALQSLAAKWPDQSTRELLAQRAVTDEDMQARGAALQALAAKWPDQITRDLLAQRAVQDSGELSRSVTLLALVANWPDQITRDLLEQRAIQDDNMQTRLTALEALAASWPDQTTRDLLAQRAVQDDDEYPRSAALEALAANWPDQTTRDLLAQRAVQDAGEYLRRVAMETLATMWPDRSTRDLLAQRAFQDEGEHCRSAALHALAAKWPDQTTRDLLAQSALEAPDRSTRGAACSLLGKMHSKLGRILPTRDLDGAGPYLDPLKPIPRKHIEKAAAMVGIRSADMAAQLASLSAHLGWDVTVGGKKKVVRKPRTGSAPG